METWKELPEIGLKVSDHGNVRTIKLNRWLRPTQVGKGYLRVNYKKVPRYVHRLVLETFIGPCPDGHEVNHKNGIRSDNRLDNLEYVTSSENTLHSIKNGSFPVGEKRYNATLKDDEVREMRELFAKGFSPTAISNKLGTDYDNTCKAIHGYTYKHVS